MPAQVKEQLTNFPPLTEQARHAMQRSALGKAWLASTARPEGRVGGMLINGQCKHGKPRALRCEICDGPTPKTPAEFIAQAQEVMKESQKQLDLIRASQETGDPAGSLGGNLSSSELAMPQASPVVEVSS